jgi:hypothetical protein
MHWQSATSAHEGGCARDTPGFPHRFVAFHAGDNYTFGTKETQPEEDPSVLARLKRLEEQYRLHGMRDNHLG